ncbi:MGDG synthase family glycosyltransferase [Streptomyces sp. 8N706]|uniref:MGDG synthase family glycosyltransferase n=1 Tax=Streptomyces sp. 8N706 TaxID=3457416 RepID=UPI003FD0ECED
MRVERRFVLISASMGAGHDVVADELARRLRARGHAVLQRDLLTLLPPGAGPALRSFYRASVRHAPRIYAGIYRAFLSGGPGKRPDVSPLAAVAERRVREVADRWRPDAVVSTFHLAAQVTGRLRTRGALGIPSAVVVTDFAVHRGWLHPGNDMHLCVTEAAARAARAGTGRPAAAPGPVVPPHFHAPGGSSAPSRQWSETFARHAPGRPPVLLSTGAWGVGSALEATAVELVRHGRLPVLLCARDERLRRRASRLPGVLALGWVEDMLALMSAAGVLVDNAAGQTAVQALAAELPVIGYRPIPGHGAHGVREMAAAGLSLFAPCPDELLSAVDVLIRPGPARERLIARGKSAFRSDAAHLIAQVAGEPPGS